MNRKLNGILFILAATIINLLILAVLMMIPFLLLWPLVSGSMDRMIAGMIMLAMFGVSLVGTYLLYNFLLSQVIRRLPLERLFEPGFISLFRRK